MRLPWIFTMLTGVLASGLPAIAAEAYVSLSGAGGSVSLFAASGGEPTATFATPPGAVDLLLSADGSKLYVGTSNSGQADVRAGSPSLVAVLDSASGTVLREFPMPASVVKMVLNAAGNRIFSTGVEANGTVVLMSLNLTTGKTAMASISGAQPFDLYTLAISPDGNTVYVPVTNAVEVFNAQTLAATGAIPLARNGIVAPPSVTPDNATLLAAGSQGVYAIDLATRSLKSTIPISMSAAAFGSALSPDGKTFYVSAGTLSAIDVASLTVKGSVPLNQTNPFRLAVSPDGATLFASDLTYGTTIAVDAALLSIENTIYSIAPPYGLAPTVGAGVFVLNENSTGLTLVNTNSLTAGGGFIAGDSPLAPVFVAGKLFVPEVGNMAIQETPLRPGPAKPFADHFIFTQGAVVLGGRVFASESGSTRVINPRSETITKSFNINTGGGAVNAVAASGDGKSLLASYFVIGIGIVLADSGIAKLDTTAGGETLISSLPFIPGAVVSSPDGARAYAVGADSGNRVGVWDTQNNLFLGTHAMSGNPFYVAVAVSKDGATLYLVDQNGKVDFADAATLDVVAPVDAGTKPSSISVSGDGTEALVTDSTASSVTVLDLLNRAVKGTVAVGAPSAGSVFLN